MSADRWSICPKCQQISKKEKEDFLLKVRDSYGKVDPEEYLRLINEAQPKAPTGPGETLREDYEFDLKGTRLFIYYKAYCEKCGLIFALKKEIDIETREEIS